MPVKSLVKIEGYFCAISVTKTRQKIVIYLYNFVR